MHTLLALLLLAGLAAAQQVRDVREILADHARALGKASKVKTLHATGEVSLAKGQTRAARIFLRADGTCLRELPGPDGSATRREYVGPEGVFVNQAGAFLRYRPSQRTTRGYFHLSRALSRPFPLLPYVANPIAQQGLRVGLAEGFEVLVGPRDPYGVRARYWVGSKSHLVEKIDFEVEENEPFIIVTFSDHRLVDGVMLPHAAGARYAQPVADLEKRKYVAKPFYRTEIYHRWVVDPDLGKVHFRPPGLGRGGAEGFSRLSFATGPGPREIAVGDLDGDSRNDLAVACWGAVYVHFGGEENKPVRLALGKSQHRGAVIEDLDRDGRPELITTCNVAPAQRYFVVTFTGERTHEVRTLYGAPLFLRDLACEDLDGDGLGDLVASAVQQLSFKFGNGAGGVRVVGSTWPLATEQFPDGRGFGLDIGHMDRDRLWDVAVADGTRVVIFQGEVNLSFHPRVEVRLGPRPVDVAFADLNADGLDDLLIANERPMEDLKGDLAVVLNTGKGLKGHTYVEAGVRTPSVTAGHFNSDDHLDVAVASRLTGEVALLYGNGRGDLAGREVLASGRGTCRVVTADCDGDGRDDLVAANGLDDTVTVFLNRRGGPRGKAAPPARAVPCPTFREPTFRLEGLSRPYEFAAEFRLPPYIRDPSAVVWLGGTGIRQLIVISDKESALFRATLDLASGRLLVGPPIPLRGAIPERLDLEGAAFDRFSGNLFLGSEADSTVLRATVFGDVLEVAKTPIPAGGNDGLEALAVRRRKDGTPLLYAFRERLGTTMKQPPILVFDMEEDPFALRPRSTAKLPLFVADQSGAAVYGGKLYVVSRLSRSIIEVGLDGDALAQEAKVAGFGRLTRDLLGLVYEDQPLFGMVEGIAFDHAGDLFLVVDNNGKEVGHAGRNRGREGRLVWLRNAGEPATRAEPRAVTVKQILVPWTGDRTQGEKIARELYERARRGEDFDALASERDRAGDGLPHLLRIVSPPVRPQDGEHARGALPSALARLAFALETGEVGLCEFHEKESPGGWRIVLRVG